MALPIILLHLTLTAVFVVGMGAIASAAMSSTDSCLLAATSIFTTNIYCTPLFDIRYQRESCSG